MKKFTLFATLTLCALLLAGCVEKPQKQPDNTGQSTNTSRTQSEYNEFTFLRSRITEKNCMLGIGFLGYIDSESDEKTVREYLQDSPLGESYPFLKELDPVLLEGAELYAFVPVNNDTVVTVYRAEPSEDGNYIDHKDTPLYTGKPGETVVLRCNLSEIHSNVLISITNGTNTREFHPMLSMMDGHVATEPGCYDFSVYEEDPVESARELLVGIDEVQDALQRGMKLLYTGDTQTIEGRLCLLFALGTDHEDQFVREQLYAVSDDLIYVFYTETDKWQVLGTKQ